MCGKILVMQRYKPLPIAEYDKLAVQLSQDLIYLSKKYVRHPVEIKTSDNIIYNDSLLPDNELYRRLCLNNGADMLVVADYSIFNRTFQTAMSFYSLKENYLIANSTGEIYYKRADKAPGGILAGIALASQFAGFQYGWAVSIGLIAVTMLLNNDFEYEDYAKLGFDATDIAFKNLMNISEKTENE